MNMAMKNKLVERLKDETYLWEDNPHLTAAGIVEYAVMVDFECRLKRALELHLDSDWQMLFFYQRVEGQPREEFPQQSHRNYQVTTPFLSFVSLADPP